MKIHKLTQAQYDRELAAGNIDSNALYLTPDEEVDLSGYATRDEVSSAIENKANKDELDAKVNFDDIATITEVKTYFGIQ